MKRVVVSGLQKTFRKDPATRPVLQDVSLAIEPGRFVSVIGPSGCGKSTLLKVIAGLIEHDAGEVRLGDEPVTGPRRDIGVMFQNPVLLAWRTVLENVALPGELSGEDRGTRQERAAGLLQMVGLAGYERYYPRELSGGMRQRAALARVLMREPALLLLDEPFGALDEFTRETLNLALMDVVATTRQTLILVTHNIGEAILMSDEIVVMAANPGRIVGRVRSDFARPRAVELMRRAEYADAVFEVRTLLGLGQA
jgi:NitT/TauT family transport system ATP-binding protein